MGYLIDLTGNRYGKLTVIERGPDYIFPSTKHHTLQWYCLCECGNKTLVLGSDLKRGKTQSCGCRQEITHKSFWSKRYYGRIKRSAKRRGIDFELTEEQVWKLSQQLCHYCKAPPGNKLKIGKRIFIYQGIDRVDSNKGYVPGNVVPCCISCNSAKGDGTYSWFKRFRGFWSDIVIG